MPDSAGVRREHEMPANTRLFKVVVLALAGLAGGAAAEPPKARAADAGASYSFVDAPYVHPRIVQDLTTWLSDSGDQVVAINLGDSQDSNRYFGDVAVRETPGKRPFVYHEEGSAGFGYEYVGETTSGLHVLSTSEWSSGSGVFRRLMLVTFETDQALQVGWDEAVIRAGDPRVLLWKRGEIGLGDRWEGELRVEGETLVIGADEGWYSSSGGQGGGWLSEDPQDRSLRIEWRR